LAQAHEERAIAIKEGRLGPEHIELASLLANLGHIELLRGRPHEALVVLERALAIYENFDGTQNYEIMTHFLLARALVETGGDRTRALAEAEKTREAFARAQDDDLAAVEAWLAEHR
jgi:hypothetical protein